MKVNMEKELVAKYGISWKEANQALARAKKTLGIAGTTSDEKRKIVEAASNELHKAHMAMVEKIAAKKEAERQAQVLYNEAQEAKALQQRQIRSSAIEVTSDGMGITQKLKVVPPLLAKAGVPLATWMMLYDAVNDELRPAILAVMNMEKTIHEAFASYVGGQVGRGLAGDAIVGITGIGITSMIGEAVSSGHELKTFRKMLAFSQVQSNLSAVANNVLARANFMLSHRYGVLVQLRLASGRKLFPGEAKEYFRDLEVNNPIGLEFHVLGTPHASAPHTSAPQTSAYRRSNAPTIGAGVGEAEICIPAAEPVNDSWA